MHDSMIVVLDGRLHLGAFMSRIDEKLEAIRQRQDSLREQWQQLKDEKIELSKAIWEDDR